MFVAWAAGLTVAARPLFRLGCADTENVSRKRPGPRTGLEGKTRGSLNTVRIANNNEVMSKPWLHYSIAMDCQLPQNGAVVRQ